MKSKCSLPPLAVYRFVLLFVFLFSPFQFASAAKQSHTVIASSSTVSRHKVIQATVPKNLNAKHYLDSIDPVRSNAWNIKDMPIVVAFKPANKAKGFNPRMIEMFKQCCLEWTEATDNRVQFEFGLRAQEGRGINVEFEDNRTGIGIITAGLTYLIDDEEGIKKADIVILTKSHHKRFYSDAELKDTMLHEIGHALGITGHSPSAKDIMVAVKNYSSNTQFTGISRRDINTVNYLYDNADTLFARALAKVESLYGDDPEKGKIGLQELASTYDGPDIRRAISSLRTRHSSCNLVHHKPIQVHRPTTRKTRIEH